jgi:hypothetical protein
MIDRFLNFSMFLLLFVLSLSRFVLLRTAIDCKPIACMFLYVLRTVCESSLILTQLS